MPMVYPLFRLIIRWKARQFCITQARFQDIRLWIPAFAGMSLLLERIERKKSVPSVLSVDPKDFALYPLHLTLRFHSSFNPKFVNSSPDFKERKSANNRLNLAASSSM